MMQSAEVDIADVHGRTHSYGFQTFQNGDVVRTVILLFRNVYFVTHCVFSFVY